MTRKQFTSKVRFFADSDQTTTIEWVFVPTDRATNPRPSFVGVPDWENEAGPRSGLLMGRTPQEQGVQLGPETFAKLAIGYPWEAHHGHVCGTADQWAGALLLSRGGDVGRLGCCGVPPLIPVLEGGLALDGTVHTNRHILIDGGVDAGGIVSPFYLMSTGGGVAVGGIGTAAGLGGLAAGGDTLPYKARPGGGPFGVYLDGITGGHNYRRTVNPGAIRTGGTGSLQHFSRAIPVGGASCDGAVRVRKSTMSMSGGGSLDGGASAVRTTLIPPSTGGCSGDGLVGPSYGTGKAGVSLDGAAGSFSYTTVSGGAALDGTTVKVSHASTGGGLSLDGSSGI